MQNMKQDLETFIHIVDQLFQDEENNPVTTPIPAETLYQEMDLSLSEEPTLEDDFKKALKSLVLRTPKTASKLFFNQLFGGRQSKAVLGDLLAVLLNNSMYTYKVAGPQVGIEKEIIKHVSNLVGYGDQSDGTFPTGGSMSNFMGLLMGRDAFDPKIRFEGVTKPLIMYTSSESHYSNSKNAAFVGIGRDNIRYIETNDLGEIIPEKLEEQIKIDLENGLSPFFVNATAGTTVLGAFDPFEAIGEICKKYNLWFHIDGAYCGSLIFSKKYKHLLKGMENSDSFSFNAHKMLGTPLSCSLIVVKDKKYLNQSFSNDATYLYQTDDDDFNLGKTSFQCGRRNDALKFWTLWKSIGGKGLENIVDHQFELADVARNYIRNNSDYELYSFDDSVSICFNYKNIDAPALCTGLYEHNELVVGFGSFKETTFVRMVTVNANNSEAEILNFFAIMEDFVDRNEASLPKIKVEATIH